MLGSPYREALGLVVLIAITAAIWVAPRLAKKYPPDVGGGIGGWLVIVGIGVCITPLYPAAETIQALGQNKWGTAVLGTLVTIWAVVNAVLFFQRKRHFPKAYIGLLVVLSVLIIVAALYESGSLKSAIAPTFWKLVEIVYILQSRRVKATFVQ